MTKPVIQIKIEGPQGSGKTKLAEAIADLMSGVDNYRLIKPASSYDQEDSCQLEDDFHIVQIRTRQTRNNGLLSTNQKTESKRANWFWRWVGRLSVWAEAKDKKAMTDILESELKIKQMERDIEWIKKTGKPYSSDRKEVTHG